MHWQCKKINTVINSEDTSRGTSRALYLQVGLHPHFEVFVLLFICILWFCNWISNGFNAIAVTKPSKAPTNLKRENSLKNEVQVWMESFFDDITLVSVLFADDVILLACNTEVTTESQSTNQTSPANVYLWNGWKTLVQTAPTTYCRWPRSFWDPTGGAEGQRGDGCLGDSNALLPWQPSIR